MANITALECNPLPLQWADLEDPERNEIIKTICNASESPELFRILRLCREALTADRDHLSAEQLTMLNALWNGLSLPDTFQQGIASLHSTCFLIDRLILSAAIAHQLRSNEHIVNCLQLHLLAEGSNRKYVYHILRTLNDPEMNAAWQSFFVIYDTLAEKQSHLILPVLELLDQTRLLPHQWHHVLLAHALNTSNNPVVRRIVVFILNDLAATDNEPSAAMVILEERFLNSLNNNFLYADLESFNINLLCNYFRRLRPKQLERQVKTIWTINWKSVPLFHLLDGLKDVLRGSDFTAFTKLALHIPNCALRRLVMQKMQRLAVRDEALLCNDRFSSSSYEAQERQMRAVCEFKLDAVLVPSQKANECVTQITIPAVNSVINKYFPEFNLPSDANEIQLIAQHLARDHEWLQFLTNTHCDRYTIDSGLFAGQLSVLTVSVVLHQLSKADWSNRWVTVLIDYELQMALQIFAANIGRVPVADWTDLLDSCLVELQSPKNSHLIASFLLLLDKLVVQELSFATTYGHYYDHVVQLAQHRPKWMSVLAGHPPVWQFATTGFMLAALTFGQPLKGDQLIEERLCLNEASSFDCIVRNSALLQLAALSSGAAQPSSIHANLFDQLQQLGTKKPRYYANSETHRLKLRLVQAIVVLNADRDVPEWHDHLETMLLTENNQLNVAYIVELLVGATVEPDRLLDMLIKAATPNARRSVFMCMFYVSRRCSVSMVKRYIEGMLVWTMGKDYSTRLCAQVVILKMVHASSLGDEYRILIETIQLSLRLVEQQKDVERMTNDFRFRVDTNRLCNFVLVLHTIPTATQMCVLEVFGRDLLVQWAAFQDDVCLDISHYELENHTSSKPLVQTELIELNVGNVQKKIVPLKELFPMPNDANNDQQPTDKEGLVVVASLISRAANLGGLARTCEIFGAEKLVLDSLRHTEATDFQALSMTAEKWLRIAEVKPFHLVDYLVEMKRRGYAIIGAEQTANGISIQQLRFAKKSVLLLGHEKEGIPANLLSLLDQAVEIPQFGVVRSLNVHVTGALFIWEYAKQHSCVV